MTQYTLPTWLGGGICTLVDRSEMTDGSPRVRVRVDGHVIAVPFEALTKVKPPAPPEPPVLSVVEAQVSEDGPLTVFQRTNGTFDWCWQSTTVAGVYSWQRLCEFSAPVLLVPATSQVVRDHASGVVTVRTRNRKVGVSQLLESMGLTVQSLTNGDQVGVNLRPSEARIVARALSCGADRIERSTP
jgi:hypothetical protein